MWLIFSCAASGARLKGIGALSFGKTEITSVDEAPNVASLPCKERLLSVASHID